MPMNIRIRDDKGNFWLVPIDAERAQELIEAGCLVFYRDRLLIASGMCSHEVVRKLVLGIFEAAPHEGSPDDRPIVSGGLTMKLVLEPAGLNNMSDIQVIMNEVEAVIEGLVMDADKRLTNPHGLAGGPLPPLAANAHGIGPDTDCGPTPDYIEPGKTFTEDEAKDLRGSTRVPGLPVAGYAPTQSQAAIDLVNEGKLLEERVLRWLDRVQHDECGFRIRAASDVQVGFMQAYRAIFQPKGSRISLPEDGQ